MHSLKAKHILSAEESGDVQYSYASRESSVVRVSALRPGK